MSTYRPLLDENGQTITQQAPDGRRAVRCVDESGASVWRPLEEFTGRAAVGAEGSAPAPAARPGAPAPASSAPLCPFCRQAVLPEATGDLAPVTCEGCATPYHADCWQANGGRCAVFGCRSREASGGAAVEALPEVPISVDLPAEEVTGEAPAVVYPAIGERPAPQAPDVDRIAVPPATRPRTQQQAPTRQQRPPQAPAPDPTQDREAREEAQARRNLRALQIERQAAEERARLAAAEDRARRIREEANAPEVEAARRHQEAQQRLALQRQRAQELPLRCGWKVIGGLFLGGAVGVFLGQAALYLSHGALGPDGGAPFAAFGEVAGVAVALLWWRVEVARWTAARDRREARARCEALAAAQQAEELITPAEAQ